MQSAAAGKWCIILPIVFLLYPTSPGLLLRTAILHFGGTILHDCI